MLADCPFCGHAAEAGPDEATGAPRVLCPGCGATSGLYETERGAVEAWNRRAGADELERARALLTRARRVLMNRGGGPLVADIAAYLDGAGGSGGEKTND